MREPPQTGSRINERPPRNRTLQSSAYLDEMTFRFDNRDNPYLSRYTLMKLIDAQVLEYKKLTAA
jgi:hypothetical protein